MREKLQGEMLSVVHQIVNSFCKTKVKIPVAAAATESPLGRGATLTS